VEGYPRKGYTAHPCCLDPFPLDQQDQNAAILWKPCLNNVILVCLLLKKMKKRPIQFWVLVGYLPADFPLVLFNIHPQNVGKINFLCFVSSHMIEYTDKYPILQ
jgi:hypothetical protein